MGKQIFCFNHVYGSLSVVVGWCRCTLTCTPVLFQSVQNIDATSYLLTVFDSCSSQFCSIFTGPARSQDIDLVYAVSFLCKSYGEMNNCT